MSGQSVKVYDRVVHHPFVTAGLLTMTYVWVIVPDFSRPVFVGLLATFTVLALIPTALLVRHIAISVCSGCALGVTEDPERAAARTVRILHLHHHPWRVVGISAGSIGAIAVAGVLAPWPVAVWVWSVAMFVLIAMPLWVPHTHGRLAPWCPYCSHDDGWGDGGPEEPSPEPTPVPGAEATS